MAFKHKELRRLEREILDRVSRTLAVLSLCASVVGAFDWWRRGEPWVIVFTGTVFVIATITSLPFIEARKRSLLLVGFAFAVSIGSFHVFAYMATPATALMFSVLLAHALFGARFATWSAILAGLSIVVLGALQSDGILPLAPGRELYAPEDFASWVRVAMMFFMVSLAGLVMIRSQQDLLVRSLDEKTSSLERLRAKAEALERSNEERDVAAKRLLDAERLEAIGQLAGSVAHDMNNTLTVVLSSAEVLRRSKLSTADAAIVEDLIQATEGGSDLCRQLLSCARRSILSPKNIAPSPFLNGVARLLSRLLPSDVKLELEIDSALPQINADEAELQHALLNLLSNSRDAIEGIGRITLRATLEDGWVWIAVEDDGVGIPEDVRDRVFEPLFTTKKEGVGTGLGLASVLGTVTQAGGRVVLDSAVGCGTIVSMGFPVVGPIISAPSRETERSTGFARTLIVDDDPMIARVVSRLLRGEDFEPTVVNNAEAALRELREHEFDILLTDVLLPGMHGPQLAEQALREWPQLRVVLMSGYVDDDSAQAIMNHGLQMLPKPFTREGLLEALNMAMDLAAGD